MLSLRSSLTCVFTFFLTAMSGPLILLFKGERKDTNFWGFSLSNVLVLASVLDEMSLSCGAFEENSAEMLFSACVTSLGGVKTWFLILGESEGEGDNKESTRCGLNMFCSLLYNLFIMPIVSESNKKLF